MDDSESRVTESYDHQKKSNKNKRILAFAVEEGTGSYVPTKPNYPSTTKKKTVQHYVNDELLLASELAGSANLYMSRPARNDHVLNTLKDREDEFVLPEIRQVTNTGMSVQRVDSNMIGSSRPRTRNLA